MMKIILSHPCIVPCLVRYNTNRMLRKEPRYEVPSFDEAGHADYFDPADFGFPNEMEDASAHFMRKEGSHSSP